MSDISDNDIQDQAACSIIDYLDRSPLHASSAIGAAYKAYSGLLVRAAMAERVGEGEVNACIDSHSTELKKACRELLFANRADPEDDKGITNG